VRDSQPNLSSAHAESLVAVVDRDTLVGPAPDSPPLRRPALALSILLDAGLAACAYVAASWLRFPADRLGQFLPKVWSTLPYVVSGQLAMLIALGGYARRPRTDWLLRVAAGVVVGTAASSIALGITIGFEGISRSAFVADAVLLSIATIGWRGMWVLRSRARGRTPVEARIGELVDRAEEMATLGAVVMSLYAYRELLRNLVIKDLKLKYRGSVFGFLWSLANPLLMIVVYTVAFTYIMRVQTDNFVFYLMLGILSWTFFANSATMSTGAIVDNAGLLKSVSLPRAIFPIATVLFNLAQYLLTVLVFLPVMVLWYRVPLTATMLLFPVFLALQVVFTIGIALILATATAFFRDVRHLLEVALFALFWTTPIVYELSRAPEGLRYLFLLSPMSPFIVAYQRLFFFRVWPEPAVWLVASAYAMGAFVIGSMLVLTFGDRFTELL
jgi:ABC-2 type transport system permease protein